MNTDVVLLFLQTKMLIQSRKSSCVNNITVSSDSTEARFHISRNQHSKGWFQRSRNHEKNLVGQRSLLAYFALLSTFKSNDVHQKTKLKIYKNIIRPILYYGSEMWALQERSMENNKLFERKILQRILKPVNENVC